MANWNSASVLHIGPEGRHVWQFSASGNACQLQKQKLVQGVEKLPPEMVAKSFSTILSKKLNLAWMPADRVYLRVLQLPAGPVAEIRSMVELQLEKLSPLPVAQAVWGVEVLPEVHDNLQTVIVIVAERTGVDEFIGTLEGQGFLADSLELGLLDQVLLQKPTTDSVWIYPAIQDAPLCAVAWWTGGILRNITLLPWAAIPNQAENLQEQLNMIAWEGEMEGWITGPIEYHLVASDVIAREFEPQLRRVLDLPVQIQTPLTLEQLAALSARRATKTNSTSNLLPADYSVRYRQTIIDRVWMGGIGALAAVYCIGVLFYFVALSMVKFEYSRVQGKITAIAQNYTNTVTMQERVRILEEQNNLKYAALDCWKAAAEKLPQELTLSSLNFNKGKTVTLFGSVPQDNADKLTDYNEALGTVEINGKLMQVSPPVQQPPRPNAAGIQVVQWNFVCTLQAPESE